MSTARKSPAGAPRRKAAVKAPPRRDAAASLPAVVPAAKNGKAAAADAQADTVAFAQQQFGRAASSLFHAFDRLIAFNRDNVEAALLSGGIVASGIESVGKVWLELAQQTLESGTAAAKAFAGTRTLQEFVALQTDLAQSALDRLLAESARIAELSTKVANDAVAPLQPRVETAWGLILRREAA